MRLFQSAYLLLITVLAGCTSSRKIVVTEQPAAPVIARPAQPATDYVWLDGDWYAVHGTYTYRDGYWARPKKSRTWEAGHWERSGGGYYWVKGHWK